MCGLAVACGQTSTDMLVATVHSAVPHLVRRGPDSIRVATVGRAAMASTRLTLWDAGDARQPSCADDRLTIFNGELFNHENLRQQFDVGLSEIETIAVGLARVGVEWLNDIDGQFAIATYDPVRNALLLVRDRWGICPLVYAQIEGAVLAASNIPAVLAMRRTKPTFRVEALSEVVTQWRPSSGGTVFENINEVLPGEWVRFVDGRLEDRGTWAAPRNNQPTRRAPNTLDDAVDAALESAVGNRMRGEVAPAVLLSGGVDSTLLATIATVAGATTSYGLRTEDRSTDRQVELAARLGFRHQQVEVTSASLLDAMPAYIAASAAPITRCGPLAMWSLAEAIGSRGTRTLLSGEGADELFLGYDSFKRAVLTDLLGRHPQSARLRRAAATLGETEALRELSTLGGAIAWDTSPQADLLPSAYRSQPLEYVARFVQPDLRGPMDLKTARPPAAGLKRPDTRQAILSAVQEFEIQTLLCGYLLQSQSDHAFAAQGIEARFPFLSGAVTQLASTIPARDLLVGLSEKVPLRRLLARRMRVPVDRLPVRSAFRVGLDVVLSDSRASAEFSGLVNAAPQSVFDRVAIERLTQRLRDRRTASERETTTALLAASYSLLGSTFGAER